MVRLRILWMKLNWISDFLVHKHLTKFWILKDGKRMRCVFSDFRIHSCPLQLPMPQQMLSATIHHYRHRIVVCLDPDRHRRRRQLHRQHRQRLNEINSCVHRSKCWVHDGNRHQCRTVAIRMTIAPQKGSQHRRLTVFPNDLAKNSIGTLRDAWRTRRQSGCHRRRQQQCHSQLKTKRTSSMRSPPKRMSIRKRWHHFHPTFPWMLHPRRPLCCKYPYARSRISSSSKNRCAWIRAFAIW